MVAELILGEPIIIILLLTDVIINKLINFGIIQLNIYYDIIYYYR